MIKTRTNADVDFAEVFTDVVTILKSELCIKIKKKNIPKTNP